jgi:hypothetical protein
MQPHIVARATHSLTLRQCAREELTKKKSPPRVSKLFLGAPALDATTATQKMAMFCGLLRAAVKRVAPAATRPFDQWCEIKSFTPLQLIAIASRPASPNAKNSGESEQHISFVDESGVVFDIASHRCGPKATVVSRAPRPALKAHGSFQKTHYIKKLFSQT